MDLWRFAREGGRLEGSLALVEFSRLEELLARTKGEIFFRAEGEMARTDDRGERARLRVFASGTLPLICQRCLSPVSFKLSLESCLELVDGESRLTQEELEDETLDFLPVARGKSGFRSALDLVEDEILLALPFAPRHDDCVLPDAIKTGASHPFAALAALKGRI